MLKGYSTGLEELINSATKKNVYIWNSGFEKLWLAPHFFTNNFAYIFWLIAILSITGYSIYYVFETCFNTSIFVNIAIIGYAIWLLIFNLMLYIESVNNRGTRQKCYDHFKQCLDNDDYMSISTSIGTLDKKKFKN